MKCQRCRFLDDPARRPAFSIGRQICLRDGLIAELSNGVQRPDRILDVHRSESRLAPWPTRMDPANLEFPDVVEVVVEIPRGSRNKYEYIVVL